ncbi:MAG: putative membrane protein YecN with MAPEG domain [Paraglaciecola psychrophila]|jgi:uncharacterized membrane protein YecN with MAPEG domain
MSIPLICIALLALLCISLGLTVSLIRGKANTLFSSPNNPEDPLYKMVRAHGNSIEYVPIIALLLFILSLGEQAPWVLWCMVAATASRYLIVAGIVFPQSMAKPNPLRFIGAMGTYLAGFGLCFALFLQAING